MVDLLRKRPGRPRTGRGEGCHRISLRANDEDYKLLEKAAREQGITVTSFAFKAAMEKASGKALKGPVQGTIREPKQQAPGAEVVPLPGSPPKKSSIFDPPAQPVTTPLGSYFRDDVIHQTKALQAPELDDPESPAAKFRMIQAMEEDPEEAARIERLLNGGSTVGETPIVQGDRKR